MKIILAFVLGASSALAQAAPITYSFTGVFDTPTNWISSGPLQGLPFNGLVKGGEHFSGQFTFDTAATALSIEPAPFNWAVYPELDFQLKASSDFNAAAPLWKPEHVQVTDDNEWIPGHLEDELIATGGADVDSKHILSAILRMSPADHSAFSNFRVPDTFNGVTSANLFLYFYNYVDNRADQVSGSVQVTLSGARAVPEPGTALLLLAGLGGFVALRRRT
jgi:hypothetical protein